MSGKHRRSTTGNYCVSCLALWPCPTQRRLDRLVKLMAAPPTPRVPMEAIRARRSVADAVAPSGCSAGRVAPGVHLELTRDDARYVVLGLQDAAARRPGSNMADEFLRMSFVVLAALEKPAGTLEGLAVAWEDDAQRRIDGGSWRESHDHMPPNEAGYAAGLRVCARSLRRALGLPEK